MIEPEVIVGDCVKALENGLVENVDMTFLDPPFNQGKKYEHFDDKMSESRYWNWIFDVLSLTNEVTVNGGAIFFMHREKNVGKIFEVMEETGWTFRNLIIWRKMSFPAPYHNLLSKRYQIIYYGVKGNLPRVFNQLTIRAPMLSWHKEIASEGSRIDDIWYDIRELTSGYLSGKETLRDKNGDKSHYQQMPLALPLRAILMSTKPDDTVFDPMMGSGTTLVAASQINRKSIGIEIDPNNAQMTLDRLEFIREADNVDRLFGDYASTPNINEIWGYRAQQTLESFI